jgi:hypothetical protein
LVTWSASESASASKKIADPDPHQFTDGKQNVWNFQPILSIIQGFEHLLGSYALYPDSNPHHGEKLNPDQHNSCRS